MRRDKAINKLELYCTINGLPEGHADCIGCHNCIYNQGSPNMKNQPNKCPNRFSAKDIIIYIYDMDKFPIMEKILPLEYVKKNKKYLEECMGDIQRNRKGIFLPIFQDNGKEYFMVTACGNFKKYE